MTACCESRVHCSFCRDPAQRAWRVQVAQVGCIPATAIDGACPQGAPWAAAPDELPHPTHGKRAATSLEHEAQASSGSSRPAQLGLSQLARQRLAKCIDCDEYNGNVCELQFPCGACLSKFLAWLDAPFSRCPRADHIDWPR